MIFKEYAIIIYFVCVCFFFIYSFAMMKFQKKRDRIRKEKIDKVFRLYFFSFLIISLFLSLFLYFELEFD